MSDGMTEAARMSEREDATKLLYTELLHCLEDSGRSHKRMLELARETDDVRGGMVGRTRWEKNIIAKLEKLRASDECEWGRTLCAAAESSWIVRDGVEPCSLYQRFKRLSPFKKDLLCFSIPPGDLGAIVYDALNKRRYSTYDDAFMYVLRISKNAIRVRPVWLRQTSWMNGELPRIGPLVRKR